MGLPRVTEPQYSSGRERKAPSVRHSPCLWRPETGCIQERDGAEDAASWTENEGRSLLPHQSYLVLEAEHRKASPTRASLLPAPLPLRHGRTTCNGGSLPERSVVGFRASPDANCVRAAILLRRARNPVSWQRRTRFQERRRVRLIEEVPALFHPRSHQRSTNPYSANMRGSPRVHRKCIAFFFRLPWTQAFRSALGSVS